ncbi:MAG: hypothetical protein IJK32_04585 [Bacteroidales bacterium]|nr:hypothetical protein [Bacteroidales bacterium]
MAKARNFDEMVVGLMHEVYGGSSYARGLFSCDVFEASLWKPVLDLFVPHPFEIRKRVGDEVCEFELLNLNRPQDYKNEDLDNWLLEETLWSEEYKDWLTPIASNRIARNVMIYELEDKLEILGNIDKYEKEYGPNYFALPWKKHYLVDIRRGRRCYISARIPPDDDSLLLRPVTDEERDNLIGKYTRAIEYLKMFIQIESLPNDYSPFEMEMNAQDSQRWLDEWIADTLAQEYYCDEEPMEDLELPF